MLMIIRVTNLILYLRQFLRHREKTEIKIKLRMRQGVKRPVLNLISGPLKC